MTSGHALTLPDRETQRWNLSASGWRHRVEVHGSMTRTITWYVDDHLVATRKSTQDDVLLEPGAGCDPADSPVGASSPGSALGDAPAQHQPSSGTIRVRFTALGRPKRVTWSPRRTDGDATEGAMVGSGGIDLDPEPDSPAALRAERIRRHPRRHAAVAIAGGMAKVGIPLLIALLGVRLSVSIPWPDVNLPSIPWPDWDLPSIPWPDWQLPDWATPPWLVWVADHLKYVSPVVMAGLLARREIRRQRQQDTLKAELEAEASSVSGGLLPPRHQVHDHDHESADGGADHG